MCLAILRKGRHGGNSYTWLNQSIINRLLSFILMLPDTNQHANKTNYTEITTDLKIEYQSIVGERAQLSEAIFYIACKKNLPMLQTYVCIIEEHA